MVLRKDATTYTRVGYQRLSQEDSGFVEEQFTMPQSRVPTKSIWLAICLFILGTILLVIGSLLVSGYIDQKYNDRTWPLIILGALMFIPGSYHSYICFHAYYGYEGYSFDSIPSFDD